MNSPRRSRNRVACRRCQRRKIRCDNNLPSCGSCLKAGVTCVNDGKQEVNRLYIAYMENRMRWLESLVQKNCPGVDVAHGPENDYRVLDEQEQMQGGVPNNHIDVDSGFAQNPCPQPDTQHDHESAAEDQARNSFQQGHEIGLVSLSSNGGPHYIGPSSGYFVARRILSDASHQRRRNTNETNAFASMNLSPLLNIPAPLPPQKDNVLELSARYFKTVHLIYPFLYEPSHMERIDRVYASERQLPLDIFHVFIVLAISALDLSRQFKVHLPVEGYYTAAMKHVDYVCGESSIDGLQSLLLLMVYALHNPSCGLNIWTLNYQCLASVIDLGLQRDIRASPAFQISVVEQEMRTRIFWVAYTFDRVICTMMGRPIGLRDEACELRFPRGTTDSELAGTAGTNQTPSQPLPPSPLLYPIHLFKLARINSEIKYVTQSISRDTPAYAYPPVRDIYTWQQDVIHSVEDWVFTIPQQDDDGYDWVARVCKARYHEVMVLLLRPSPGIPSPSDHSLDLCFHHAVDLLRDFGVLYRSGYLLYSRLVVHSILLGTLVMLHCIWKVPAVAANCRLDELAVVLNTSQNILSSIGEYWDEANRARDCVAELSSLTLQRLLRTPVAANAAASLTYRARSRFNYTQVALEVTSNPTHCQRQEHRDLVDKCSVTMGGSNMNIHSAYRQDEDTNPTSEFTNLFDNFLQDNYQGWDGMSNIDCLMWEVFR